MIVGLLLLVAGAMDAFAAMPTRVVSLDYCADQFVLKLLPKDRILAVSPDATRSFSYMRQQAVGIPTVRPVAEDVLMQAPDLAVRSYGGGAHITHFLKRVGLPVLQVPMVNDLSSIRESIRFMAVQLGMPQRGEDIIADMDRRLAALTESLKEERVLYMTPSGVTGGQGTLVDEMLRAAGYQNFEERSGWWSLPLERLAYEQPDLVAAAYFDERTNHPNVWSAMRHPVAKRQLSERQTVFLEGAWMACGGWFLLDAIEALATAPLARR